MEEVPLTAVVEPAPRTQQWLCSTQRIAAGRGFVTALYRRFFTYRDR